MTAIAEAASVLLARRSHSLDVFLVRRAEALRFFGGFHAFPGGRVDAADTDLARAQAGISGIHVAAIRELFEETGVLIVRTPEGDFPADAELPALRRELIERRLAFPALFASRKWNIRPDDLTPVGGLVTPAFSPLRFNTHFFVATLPPGQAAEVWPGELAAGEWLSAEAALDDWTRGTRLVSPPTVTLLEAIRGRPIEDLPARVLPLLGRLAAGEPHPIAFAPDVDMIPLHCAGLPPSSHTNAWLVGRDPAYLLDPGPTDPAEQGMLFGVLDRHAAAGRRLAAVVLTHHHPDHIGAAEIVARRYQVPVLAHAETARLLAGKVKVDRLLADGEALDLGLAPDGTGPWRLKAILTPGHAPGHLAFYEPHYRLLFAGDMVSTLSSVAIVPPEGDLAAYLASLQRLLELPARLLLPAHGAPTARPAFALEECLAHRRLREEQLLEALAAAARSIPDLASELYRGLPANLTHLAHAQTYAGLLKLQREGRAAEDGPVWRHLP